VLDDLLHPQPHELGRECRKAVHSSFGDTILDRESSAFVVSELAEPFAQFFEKLRRDRVARELRAQAIG
jgi:hypothetical protein